MSRTWFAVLVALFVLCPLSARADDDVDAGRRLFEEAEFLPALDAFARAEAGESLSVQDLTTLFETRALVHLAMGNVDAMRDDLARLAVIDPEHTFDRRARPEVRSTWAEVRAESAGAVRLRVSAEASSIGVTLGARVEDDAEGLVRRIVVRARAAGALAWLEVVDAPLLVEAQGVVEYYVLAVGPGGVTLANSGSESEPLRTVGGTGTSSSAPVGGGDTGEAVSGDDSAVWIVVGVVIGALVIGGAVTAGVLIAGETSANTTRVEPFTVRF